MTRRKIGMTARGLVALKPEAGAVDWFDAETKGLALHITPADVRTWYLFYTRGQTVRRLKLGRYSHEFGLADARVAARKARAQIDAGADPATERRAAREVLTVADLCTLYLDKHARPHKKTWQDDAWRLDRYIRPAWGSRAVRELTRADVHALLDKIVADGKPTQANRIKALISKLFNFAVDRGEAAVNPCYRMRPPTAERPRTRVCTDAELQALWRALEAEPGPAADAVRLRLLTGQRGAEVHAMRWADIDRAGKVWTVPAEDAKNNQAHAVPLSLPAAAILTARWEAERDPMHVFPGLYHQRKDLRALAAIHNGAYRWHDLRRVVASRLAGLGIAEEVIGRVLNHKKRGITATVYNVHRYDDEKRRALDLWARELARIVSGAARPTAKVVAIAR
jgi:integrase